MDNNLNDESVGDHAPPKGFRRGNPMMHRTREPRLLDHHVGGSTCSSTMAMCSLNAADVVVQQATNHAWVNRKAGKPCRVAFIRLIRRSPDRTPHGAGRARDRLRR